MNDFLGVGEKITCESGHQICSVVKQISAGEEVDVSCFGEWVQLEPELGEPFPLLCNKCGSHWMRGDGFEGLRIHTVLGWWPKPSSDSRTLGGKVNENGMV